MRSFMNTAEVADYLRLKPRKIYELVRTRRIPCSRVTGRLLFPRNLIDLWVAQHVDVRTPLPPPSPPICAGSHDPLLEWALRESGCELALLTGGSQDGLRRLAEGQATVAGIHILDAESGEYNVGAAGLFGRLTDLVLIQWAWREQGLVLASGNPLGIRGVADLGRRRLRVARRQEGSGTQILFRQLLKQAKLRYDRLAIVDPPALSQTDLATTILDGKADCGLAVRAVAERFRLGFLPLHRERFDLAMRRRDYFERPVQTLLGFARSAPFQAQAASLGGYGIGETGRVVHNA